MLLMFYFHDCSGEARGKNFKQRQLLSPLPEPVEGNSGFDKLSPRGGQSLQTKKQRNKGTKEKQLLSSFVPCVSLCLLRRCSAQICNKKPVV
jgi:hypothetical protein